MGFNGLMYHLNPLSPHSPSPTLINQNQSIGNQSNPSPAQFAGYPPATMRTTGSLQQHPQQQQQTSASQRPSSPLSIQAPVTTYKWMHVKRNPPKPG
jgi:hypothetical protein